MGFFKRNKEIKKKKTKAKDEMLVSSEIPEDVEQILTMPESVIEEGLITKPDYQEYTKETLSTSESTLPFTAPVEDENYAEAEMLNKLEAEQNAPQEDNQSMIDALSDAMAIEMEQNSDELMEVLNNLPTQPDDVDMDSIIEDEQFQKEKRKQAMSQILSGGNAVSSGIKPIDIEEVFASTPKAEPDMIKPTEKVSNIFSQSNIAHTSTRPTPSELVHNVFGKEKAKSVNNELPTRDSMREMLSSQKQKTNSTLPTKNELFKTITNKDK